MPGFELIGKEEQSEINDMFENGVIIFRHSFDNLRNGCYKVRDFEKALKGSFSGDGELNPQLVYKQIDTLSVENLAKLIKIVKEAIKD